MKNFICVLIFLYLFCFAKLYAQAPVISSFSPAAGTVGSIVTIKGSNFNNDVNGNVIYFGATKATIITATDKQITAKVPAGATYQPISELNTSTGLIGFSNNPYIVTFPSKHSIGIDDFIEKLTIDNKNTPSSIDVGDIDGDGKPDLAVTCSENNSLSIYRNISTVDSAGFAPAVTFATGGEPGDLKIADMDGDGKLDVLLINYYNTNISIYLNQSVPGSINNTSLAAPKVFFSVYGSPSSIAVADINGDGKPDLVIGNTSYQHQISIVQNNSVPGNLDLYTVFLLTCKASPISLCTTDLDGDGKPEIIVANGDNTFSVFQNTSTGGDISSASFAPGKEFTASYYISSVCAGDLNNDGKPDVILQGGAFVPSTLGGNIVYSFLNTSKKGSISFSPYVSNIIGSGNSINLADIDGDGKPEILAHGENNYTILYNVSSSNKLSFNSNTNIPLNSDGGPITIVDLNGDGISDVINITRFDHYISVLFNKPESILPAFISPPIINSINPKVGIYNSTIQIKGQNFNSVASLNQVGFGVTGGKITNASESQLTVQVPLNATYSPLSVVNLSNGLTGISKNAFIPISKTPQKIDQNSYSSNVNFASNNPISTQIADINGDGLPDMISITNYTSFTVLPGIISKYEISFGDGIAFNLKSSSDGLAVKDIDGDGKPDIIIFDSDQREISIFINQSTATNINFAPELDLPTGANILRIADIDGDGKPDIVISSANSLLFLLNQSTPDKISFVNLTNLNTGISPLSLDLKDIDGDGKPDIIIPEYGIEESYACVYLNQSGKGGVAFSGLSFFDLGPGERRLVLADLDGDNKLDIISNDPFDNANTINILKNKSSNGSASFSSKTEFPITNSGSVSNNAIAVGDIDGDGKPDIALNLKDVNKIAMLHNKSTTDHISLDAPVEFLTGVKPQSVTIADLSGDGKPEIIINRVQDINGNLSGIEILTNGLESQIVTSTDTLIYPLKSARHIFIDSLIDIKTLRDAPITDATVAITANFNSSEDALALVKDTLFDNVITAKYDDKNGILKLTAISQNVNINQWVKALKSITYTNNNKNTPDTSIRTVSFSISNSNALSDPNFKNIKFGIGTMNGLPIPVITPNGPTAFLQGDSVILSATPASGYSYQWANNGVNIAIATAATYAATKSGAYTVSITLNSKTATSDTVKVNAAFALPSNNFKLTVIAASCNGSNSGSININAVKKLPYSAILTSNNLLIPKIFTDTTTFSNLSAGNYSVCITVAGQDDYRQCFDLIIKQPQNLSVYSVVSNVNKNVNLSLSGGEQYNILLNGIMYSTKENSIILPLNSGTNDLTVSTDKLCQGIVKKMINSSDYIALYPIPFQNILNINLGNNNVTHVSVQIHNVSDGKLVYSKQYANQTGVLQLDLASFKDGVYALHLSADNFDKTFKIIKQ